MKIYHHITKLAWKEAQEKGIYVPKSYKQEGFIHCSTRKQVIPTANRKLKGISDLYVLIINTSMVKPKIIFEKASNGEMYPHIYGPLNLDSIIEVKKLETNKEGLFTKLI